MFAPEQADPAWPRLPGSALNLQAEYPWHSELTLSVTDWSEHTGLLAALVLLPGQNTWLPPPVEKTLEKIASLALWSWQERDTSSLPQTTRERNDAGLHL